jgi:hypothetical protein
MCIVSRYMERPQALWQVALGLSAVVLLAAGVVIGM